MNTIGFLIAFGAWIMIVVTLFLTGCTFGGYIDRVEAGSRLEAVYQKNRFENVQTGMQYVTAQEEKPDVGNASWRNW